MKIVSLEYASKKATVYDIETPSHSYLLSNGIISHNTMEMYSKAIMSGGCVIEGTKIQTPEGLVEVQNIKEGDLVKTLEGYNEVTHTWNPETLMEGNPECYEIEFHNGSKVVCSADHMFLDEDMNWVPAKELFENGNVISL